MGLVFETIKILLLLLIVILVISRIVTNRLTDHSDEGQIAKQETMNKFLKQDRAIIISIALFAAMNVVNMSTDNFFSGKNFVDSVKNIIARSQMSDADKNGGVLHDYVPRDNATDPTPITETSPKETSAPGQPSVFATNSDWALNETKVVVSNYDKDNEYQYYVSSSKDELKDGEWTNFSSNQATIDKAGINYAFVKATKDGKESNLSAPLEVKVDNEVPTAPTIIPTSSADDDSQTFKLKTLSEAESGIRFYEYYLSTKPNALEGGVWQPFTKELTINSEGSFYLFIRSVSYVGLFSPVSEYQRIVIKVDDPGSDTPINDPEPVVEPNPTPTPSPNPTPTPTPVKVAPAKPVLSKRYNGWISIENIVTVDTTKAGSVAVDHYEYYMSTSKTELKGGSWVKMSGNTFKFKKDGVYFAYVRAIGKDGAISALSNPLEMWWDLVKPTAPTITGGSTSSASSRTISVSKESTAKAGINSYEYYVSTSATSQVGGSWIEISGKSVTIQTKGTHYVFFRGISWSWLESNPSNAQTVVIGTTSGVIPAPVISIPVTTGKWTELSLSKVLIYTGDSRTNRTKKAINDNYITFVCQEGTDYYYQVGYARTEIEKILTKDSNKVVIFASGTNDMNYIEDYIKYYKEMIAKWPKTKFYFMTISPVDWSIMPYSTTQYNQTKIDRFNSRLKAEFKDKYIDIYNKMVGNLKGNTLDGLHYTPEYYRVVHKMVMEYVVNNLNK